MLAPCFETASRVAIPSMRSPIPDFCRSNDRGAGIGPTLPNGSSPNGFAAKAMLARRRSPWTTEPRFAIPNTVLHGGGNKIVEASLTVQVHYAFIDIKGDRSYLKKRCHVFIVADDLDMRCPKASRSQSIAAASSTSIPAPSADESRATASKNIEGALDKA
jgi:hypothetical protein